MHALLGNIKQIVEKHLAAFLHDVDRIYSLSKFSPLLFNNIQDFVLRDGKRIRPILFVIGYRGYSTKTAANLYTSALSFELLHDFTLIHDDIIDKSELRRGRPAVHTLLNNYLTKYKRIKCNGQDLAIVIGDVLYAIAMHAFLSIKEDRQRKERALKNFIETAIYTGAGEFGELLSGTKPIEMIKKDDVYKIYDLKTAYYSFASPLITGAILAGAHQKEIAKHSQYGLYVGRAFQIKDDIVGVFGDEQAVGKSPLTDLQEAKKTILVWYAYNHSGARDQCAIKNILAKKQVGTAELARMRKIITASGALDFAKRELACLMNQAQKITATLTMKKNYKHMLHAYPRELLSL